MGSKYKGMNPLTGLLDISYLIAMFMRDKPNQNFKLLITGMTGRGKSDLLLFIAFNVACWLSVFEYGTPERWQKFFNYDGTYGLSPEEIKALEAKDEMPCNLIVINKDKVMRLTKLNKPRFSIVAFDEVQEMANALDYKEAETRFFVRINQLLRNRGWIVLASIQEQGSTAKQGRNLYHINVTVDGPDATDYSVNFSRAFYTSLKSLVGMGKPQHNSYPREAGYKWVLGASMLAPPQVRKFYEELRDKEELASTDKSMEDIMKQREMKEAHYERTVGMKKADFVMNIARMYKEENGKKPTAKYIIGKMAEQGKSVSKKTVYDVLSTI